LEFEKELVSVITDLNRPDSLASTLAEIARVGLSVREHLSGDMISLIHQLQASFRADAATPFLEFPAMLTKCLELLSAFSGMERENILRGVGWLFMSTGRRLERAIFLARQLREITRPLGESDWPLLECILQVADSSMSYRARYFTTLQPLAVLDILMADTSNPRSLDFQLTHIVQLYRQLPRNLPDDLNAIQDALTMLRSFDLRKIKHPLPGATVSPANGLVRLERFLKSLETLLPSWSNNLSSRYFSHARTLPITVSS
jgi:uncharacterized alpha-E superfamily protein